MLIIKFFVSVKAVTEDKIVKKSPAYSAIKVTAIPMLTKSSYNTFKM